MSPRNTATAPASGNRHARRAAKAAVGSAAFAWSVLLLSGTAHADAPPAEAPPAPNPAGDSLWVPASPAPAAEAPPPAPAPATAPEAAPPPASAPAPTAAPAPEAATQAPAPTEPAAAGPPNQATQDAAVTNDGTATGNSGANTAIGNASGGVQAQPCPTSGTTTLVCTTNPTGTAGVTSGGATATGTNSGSGINQQTNIQANEEGQVDVLQVALIINIGVGISNSGANAAGAAGGTSLGAGGAAGIGTGNVNVTGLMADTEVVQGVTVVGGSASDQSVTVVNIGVGIGNSGLNLAAGSVLGGGTQEVAAGGSPGNGSATIGTGDANAVGDDSGSLIMQIVTVTADDNGSITVTQRAVIVNFGLALANSGGNVAASALSAVPEVQRTVIEGLIAALFGLDPAVLFGGGSAAIGTGQANATGNQSQSSVLQQVTGGVDGDETATADQSAWIGNFGAALANSGINGAAGSVAVLPDGSPIASAEAMIARFLQLLTDPSQLQLGNTELSSALNLGSALLDVHGDIDATEVLAGLDEGEAWETSEGGIRIRQITGVLNIAIALANSGDNVAISGTVGADPQTHEGVAGQVTGKAMILTGPVDVIGQRASTVVCQIIGEDDSICPTADVDDDDVVTPPVTPLPPGPPPVTPPPAPTEVGETPVLVRERPVEAGSLPRTGAPLTLQALLGLALTGGGVLVTRRTRRSH